MPYGLVVALLLDNGLISNIAYCDSIHTSRLYKITDRMGFSAHKLISDIGSFGFLIPNISHHYIIRWSTLCHDGNATRPPDNKAINSAAICRVKLIRVSRSDPSTARGIVGGGEENEADGNSRDRIYSTINRFEKSQLSLTYLQSASIPLINIKS